MNPECNLDILVSNSVLKRRMPSQRLGIKNVEEFYTNPMNVFPELALAYGCNGKVRKEQRQAVVLVLKAMIFLLDLATMELGCLWKKGVFFGSTHVKR